MYQSRYNDFANINVALFACACKKLKIALIFIFTLLKKILSNILFIMVYRVKFLQYGILLTNKSFHSMTW